MPRTLARAGPRDVRAQLSAGLAIFELLLKARRWQVFRCNHEAFTTLLPGGPGTGISWKHGRLHEVVIDAGGSWGHTLTGSYIAAYSRSHKAAKKLHVKKRSR